VTPDLLLGPLEGIFRVIFLAVLAVKVFSFVDALLRPGPAWRAAVTQSRTFWLVILGLAAITGLASSVGLVGVAGLVAALVYLLDVRPKLRAVQRPGGRPW
jgi:hypothetical protein